ncbi:MAG TPA: colicin E3/pyocin S6 family cytotoxin [Acetobacteraceae bacterium]|nr:colicin E3/pyocin S6 family cytotoxin [Acetobacteraceae bacterium]
MRSIEDNVIYTLDALHGEIEACDGRGHHIGVVDAMTG